MYRNKEAQEGRGIALILEDRNGTTEHFYYIPLLWDESEGVDIKTAHNVSADMLRDLAIWLAENGYLPNSDGGIMELAGSAEF